MSASAEVGRGGARDSRAAANGMSAADTSMGTHGSYPPQAGATPAPPTSTAGPATTSYLIHTKTNSLYDLRLQVSIEPPSPTTSAKGKQVLRPVYFRERELTEQGEIVDSLVDATTAHVPWSIHKPTRGWYLRLRSPMLPPGSALPFRPPRRNEPASSEQRQSSQQPDTSRRGGEATALQGTAHSPLLISLPVSVNHTSLGRMRETIDELPIGTSTPKESGRRHTKQLTSISLDDGPSELPSTPSAFSTRPHGRTLSGAHKKNDAIADDGAASFITPTIIADDFDPNHQTDAVASSTGRSAPLGHGHTRRRSGGSGSHRVEVRKVSNEPREALLRERLDEEDEDADQNQTRSIAETSRQRSKQLAVETRDLDAQADRLSPGQGLGRSVLSSSPSGAYSADRPYSPTEPSALSHPLGDDGSVEHHASGVRHQNLAGSERNAPPNAASTGGPPGPSTASANSRNSSTASPLGLNGPRTAPMLCHFVLLDGVDAASYEARQNYLPPSSRRPAGLSSTAGGSRTASAGSRGTASSTAAHSSSSSSSGSLDSLRRRWATWAWSKLPATIRPGALPLDTTHDFSVHWTNPPGLGQSVEVIRFRDLEGWSIFSSWNAQRRGRLILQEEAVRAVGLGRAFWVAVALAYLDFLEGRDSYNAACEG